MQATIQIKWVLKLCIRKSCKKNQKSCERGVTLPLLDAQNMKVSKIRNAVNNKMQIMHELIIANKKPQVERRRATKRRVVARPGAANTRDGAHDRQLHERMGRTEQGNVTFRKYRPPITLMVRT